MLITENVSLVILVPVQVANLQEEHLLQAGCNNLFAHWTAMKKLRLHRAVNRKIKTQLISETQSFVKGFKS